MTKRKQFSAEFKREAVRLLETSKKQPSDLARGLGVRRKQPKGRQCFRVSLSGFAETSDEGCAGLFEG
jgi:transposase-like protein